MIALMGLSLIGASVWAIFIAALSQDVGQSHISMGDSADSAKRD